MLVSMYRSAFDTMSNSFAASVALCLTPMLLSCTLIAPMLAADVMDLTLSESTSVQESPKEC